MRTTLTLDSDVAAHLERMRADSHQPFKALVNEALRQGLSRMDSEPSRPRGPFTRPTSLGRPRLPDVDDVSEAIAVTEGDAYR